MAQADTQFKPGQSGNPGGRPKGARTKLNKAFLEDLHDVWARKGKQVLEDLADSEDNSDKASLARLAASTLPKELDIATDGDFVAVMPAKAASLDEWTKAQQAKANGSGNGRDTTAD